MTGKQNILLDSGAYSAWQRNKPIVLQQYIDFIKENLDIISVYANLDDITDPEITWKNQEEMERQGLNPLPVYHVGEPEKFLERAMRDYDYFAVGGMALKGASVRENQFDYIFGKVCGKENDYYPSHKLHGFGLTSPSLMLKYPWYSVDSVTGDSILLLRECGRVRIETIESFYNSYGCYGAVKRTSKYGHHYKNITDVETYTVDKKGKGKWSPISKVIRHEVSKNIFDINTSQGHRVSVTGDHSCFIVRDNQKICVPTKEITIYDKIIKVNYSDSFSDLKELIIEIEVPTYQKTDLNHVNKNKVKRPKRVVFSKEFLEFSGLWIADGHFDKDFNSVGISAANDPECLELLKTIASKYGKELKEKSNGVDSTIHSKELVEIMKGLKLLTGSHNKEIPWWVFELSRENLCSFLRGYFSGDGTVTDSIDYSTVSINLLYGIHFLLNKLGFYPMISFRSEVPSGSINDLEGKRGFFEEIKFLQQYKNIKLEESICNKIPRGKRATTKNQETYLFHKGVQKNRARKIMVYDLEVPGEQSFLANGLLVHNSTSWVMYGKYGLILFPRSSQGVYKFNEAPYVMSVSARSKGIGEKGHFKNYKEFHQEKIIDYCESLGFKMGRSEIIKVDSTYKLKEGESWIKKGKIVEVVEELGLCNNYELRDQFNLLFFLNMEKEQRAWPWPWHSSGNEVFF